MNIGQLIKGDGLIGESFYSYERKDNQSLSEYFQTNIMNMVNDFSQQRNNKDN